LISQWENSIDKIVFEEQLQTRQFQGRELDEDTLMVMRMAQKEGRIMPYYGAGGGRGACVYVFRPSSNHCELIVEHSPSRKTLELTAEIVSPQSPIVTTKSRQKFKYSILSYFIDEKVLPEEWQKGTDSQLICKITGKEYEKLQIWEHWIDGEAITPRYTFHFGTVSLGSGFTIRVEDSKSRQSLNATDYDSW
jgi:hypothetical protein